MEMETLKPICPIHGPEEVADSCSFASNFEEKISIVSATSQDNNDEQQHKEIIVGWKRPQPSWLKVNTASRGNPDSAACGAVIRDESGKMLRAAGRYLGVTTAMVAEASGVKLGLELARSTVGSKIWVELDSQCICMMINGEIKDIPRDIETLIQEIKHELQLWEDTKVTHIHRDGNKVADKLANMVIEKHAGNQYLKELQWTGEPPTHICNLLYRDNCGLNGIQTSELESTATSMKRYRFEASHVLLEEIREINQHKVDLAVVINDAYMDIDATLFGIRVSEATFLNCSFNPPALSPCLKTQLASAQSSVMAIDLLVPPNYPGSSPIILSVLPPKLSEACLNLSREAWSRCCKSLDKHPRPFSLTDVVRTWEDCCRAVITDNADNEDCARGVKSNNALEKVGSSNSIYTALLTKVLRRKFDNCVQAVKAENARKRGR